MTDSEIKAEFEALSADVTRKESRYHTLSAAVFSANSEDLIGDFVDRAEGLDRIELESLAGQFSGLHFLKACGDKIVARAKAQMDDARLAMNDFCGKNRQAILRLGLAKV